MYGIFQMMLKVAPLLVVLQIRPHPYYLQQRFHLGQMFLLVSWSAMESGYLHYQIQRKIMSTNLRLFQLRSQSLLQIVGSVHLDWSRATDLSIADKWFELRSFKSFGPLVESYQLNGHLISFFPFSQLLFWPCLILLQRFIKAEVYGWFSRCYG